VTEERRAPPAALVFASRALAFVGLFAAWLPGLGLALAGAALACTALERRRGGSGAPVLGAVAALLGLGFTLAYGACTPREPVAPLAPWPAFDAAFSAGSP